VRFPRLSDQSGFTLIEVLVAALVLILGATATFQLVDNANSASTLNQARTSGTNLAREITEYARGTDYDKLQPATLVSALRQNPTIAGTSASPWTIVRARTTYTVTASVCTFDDPKDGVAAAGSAPTNACASGATDPSVTKTDVNPDDFRRVTVTLNWKLRTTTGTMTQSVLVVNPAGGLGPRITAFTEPTGDITANTVSWGGASPLVLTTSATPAAAGVHWSTDDGVSQGDATGSGTAWSFTWNLGTPKLSPLTADGTWVVDGNYTVSAQATDARGVPGESRLITLHINRHAPTAPSGLEGGYNARLGQVDLRWTRNQERDIRGYTVYRASSLLCPSGGAAYTTARSCTDTSPPSSGSQDYTVKAVDCTSLAAATCAPREGAGSTLTVNLSASPWNVSPGVVTASVVDGLVKLDWSAVGGAKFYRIYRDSGTGLSGRYDETITSSPTYTDPNPGSSTLHTYWVTAVDNNFNESQPSLPVVSPGP
jgi:prepilin-type N-terminal cleavage/methylation domain-containing protein